MLLGKIYKSNPEDLTTKLMCVIYNSNLKINQNGAAKVATLVTNKKIHQI